MWTADIPPLPEAIGALTSMRREAEDAWEDANTLLSAISAWYDWLNLSRIQYSAENEYDIETGDEICRAGENAIRGLCSLGLHDPAFDGEQNLLYFGRTPHLIVLPQTGTWRKTIRKQNVGLGKCSFMANPSCSQRY